MSCKVFDVCVRNCMLWALTSKLNSTLGTFNDMCPKQNKWRLFKKGNSENSGKSYVIVHEVVLPRSVSTDHLKLRSVHSKQTFRINFFSTKNLFDRLFRFGNKCFEVFVRNGLKGEQGATNRERAAISRLLESPTTSFVDKRLTWRTGDELPRVLLASSFSDYQLKISYFFMDSSKTTF